MSQGSSSAKITKFTSDALDVVTVARACCEKYYITAHPTNPAEPFSMFDELAKFVRDKNAVIVQQDVFGCCELYTEGLKAITDSCGRITWPVTWIQGDCGNPGALTGTQAYAISGAAVQALTLHGKIIGATFEDEYATYCLLADMKPTDTTLSKNEQARKVLEIMEEAIGLVDMDFSNVVRTWIYVDSILTWYNDFNTVRNKFFQERNVFGGIVPASTGIGAGNPAGTALIADLFAIKPKANNVKVTAVPSPLQCPALDYKSSFSRAVEVALPDHKRLYVSGTASIEPGGKTAHVGDIEKQIALTMEVVKAILESRQMSWSDVSRAIGYFKDVKNVPLFAKYCKENNIPAMPTAIAHADMCRDDLLYEVELEAVTV